VDAEQFVSKKGGNLKSSAEAIKSTFEDIYTETKKIQERRKMCRMENR